MKWRLLLLGITLQAAAIGQSTLKIYVANDDTRSDMDIIYINTSALDRYGQAVDSTNINHYSTTMSTQVMRMSRLELFGPPNIVVPEEKPEEEVVAVGGNSTVIVDESAAAIALQKEKEISEAENANVERKLSKKAYMVSPRSSKSKRRKVHLKRSKKGKKYKGQCPSFF